MTQAARPQSGAQQPPADARMTVLGVTYHNISRKDAINRALQFVESKTPGHVFFANADCVYQASQKPDYRELLQDAPLVLSDGIGISLATRLLGGRMVDNCNGTDLSPLLIEEAARRGHSVYLLGGRPGVAERAAQKLAERFPELKLAGWDHGYHDDDNEVIDCINASGADILFVGFGVPLQEEWICRNRQRLHPQLCLGVGALLDFLSGRVPRAPRLLRTMRMEWTWRFLVEPRRLFRRYFIDGSRFAGRVLTEAIRQRSGR